MAEANMTSQKCQQIGGRLLVIKDQVVNSTFASARQKYKQGWHSNLTCFITFKKHFCVFENIHCKSTNLKVVGNYSDCKHAAGNEGRF